MSGIKVVSKTQRIIVKSSDSVSVINAGPPGPPGVPGSPGASSSYYRHEQSTALSVWDIVHNLGFRPNVSAFDSFGAPMDGVVSHIDINHLTITFLSPIGGEAELS